MSSDPKAAAPSKPARKKLKLPPPRPNKAAKAAAAALSVAASSLAKNKPGAPAGDEVIEDGWSVDEPAAAAPSSKKPPPPPSSKKAAAAPQRAARPAPPPSANKPASAAKPAAATATPSAAATPAEKPQPDPASDPGWMVRSPDGGLVGPVPVQLIERGLNVGRVPREAEVARAGTDSWLPVTAMLAAELPPEPSAPGSAEQPAVITRAVVEVSAPPSDTAATPTAAIPNPAPIAALTSATAASASAHAQATHTPSSAPASAIQQPKVMVPGQPAEPDWAIAATAVLPRVTAPSTQTETMYNRPAVLPQPSLAPAIVAFVVTVVVGSVVALAILL